MGRDTGFVSMINHTERAEMKTRKHRYMGYVINPFTQKKRIFRQSDFISVIENEIESMFRYYNDAYILDRDCGEIYKYTAYGDEISPEMHL